MARPSSRVVDILLSLLAVSTIATTDATFSYRSNLMLSVCVVAILASALYFSVLPYLRSRPLADEERKMLGISEHLRLRASVSDGFRAIDLIFLRCIVIPANFQQRDLDDVRFQIAHENGHLQNRDPLFFHFIFPAVLVSGIVAAAVGIFSPDQVFSNPLSDLTADRAFLEQYGWALIFVFAVAYPVFAFGVALQTLRDREFAADYWAHNFTAGKYGSFLRHQALMETFRRPGNIGIRLWNSLTHPSFKDRVTSLDKDQSALNRPTVVFGIAFSLFFAMQAYNLLIGGMGGGIVSAVGKMASDPNVSKLGLAVSFLPMLGMFVSFLSLGAWLSIVAANSAQNDPPARQFWSTLKTGVVLAIVFRLIGEAGILLVPESERGSEIGNPSMIAGYVQAIAFLVLCVFWTVWQRVFRKAIYNFFFHLFLGVTVIVALIFL